MPDDVPIFWDFFVRFLSVTIVTWLEAVFVEILAEADESGDGLIEYRATKAGLDGKLLVSLPQGPPIGPSIGALQ